TTAQKAQAGDVVSQIIYALRAMGVAPIPRNYQLFYEAYIGSNGVLTQDLAALGSRATQEELDILAERHLGQGNADVIERVHGKLVGELDDLLRLLRLEQRSMESYTRLLSETAGRINSKASSSSDLIHNAIAILASATSDTMAHGEKTADSVAIHSSEMDEVRKELDEY